MLVRSYRTVSPLPVLGCPSHRRSFLCGTVLHVTATRVSRAPCPLEPRLSSPLVAERCGHPADSPSASILAHAKLPNKTRNEVVTAGYSACVSDDEVATAPVHEVGEFYQLLTAQLESAFGRRHPHWVRGEIAKVYEKGHIYVDLVDAGTTSSDTKRPVLNAHCWATQWAPLKRKLASEGVTLTPGVIVNFYGYVDVYAPQGKIGFTITQIDVQGLLGDVARRRQELIARLVSEGLMDANKRVAISPVPLRVGLVASPGTEGYSDFTGQLLNSGFGFEIVLVKSAVQGDAAPPQIVAAIATLDNAGVDII